VKGLNIDKRHRRDSDFIIYAVLKKFFIDIYITYSISYMEFYIEHRSHTSNSISHIEVRSRTSKFDLVHISYIEVRSVRSSRWNSMVYEMEFD